jgi:hypothetical protein
MRPGRYVLICLVVAVAVFAGVWGYIRVMPMAFLEGAYPIWVAKQGFVARCDLGQLAIFGDSRPESAIDPRLLPVPATSITFGASSPVETAVFVARALRCPTPPRRIVLAFAPADFTGISEYFWENGGRFGFLSFADMQAVTHTADRLGDGSLNRVSTRLGLTGWVRNAAYSIWLPPLYFNSLVAARGDGRLAQNLASEARVRAARGYVPYPPHKADLVHAPEAEMTVFQPVPVQNYYFDRILREAARAGVQVDFLMTPISQTTQADTHPAMLAGFIAYIQSFTQRYPNFHLLTPRPPVWNDRYFSDDAHLDPAGAVLFTRMLASGTITDLPNAGP